MSNYGKETVVIVEIDQPLCGLTYASAPCTAVLGTSGTKKCFNSRATCQDAANYAPGTLTLRFGYEQEDLARHYGNVLPMLQAVSTTPAQVNLAGMDKGMSALGTRESVSLRLKDARHSDFLVDKYRIERATGAAQSSGVGYAPYKRGTFWSKWLARNPYHANYALRVRQGFLGQALADMRVRHYIIDRVDGPVEGFVTIVAKDAFSKIEAKKAVAPKASKGELAADITSVATSATLAPAGIGNSNYPASFDAALGEEIVGVVRVNDAMTLTRGKYGTVAAEHKDEDLVQVVLNYTSQLAHDIVYDLLVNYTGIPAADIDKTAWNVAAAPLSELYTTHIAKPTPVAQLLGELAEQAGFTVYPDVSTGKIEFVALRPSASVATLDDNAWLVDKSVSVKREIAKRVSQVWVYYAQINPMEELDEKKNYRSRVVSVDLDAEGGQQYGTPAIREVFSRWIPQGGRTFALGAGDRILAMFRDPPQAAQFRLHASRDGRLSPADFFTLKTAEVQDDTGSVKAVTHAVTSIERGEFELAFRSQSVAFNPAAGTTRQIFIDSDVNDINLRTLHDSLYAAPTGSEVIEFIVTSGVTVGSTSTSTRAIRTGSWPTMTTRPLLRIQAGARVQGMGGRGGDGALVPSLVGVPGFVGGDALWAEVPLTVDNLGELFSGGGGGAGGPSSGGGGPGGFNGGGGGGAAGTLAGAGGVSTSGNGAAGTRDAGGVGGASGALQGATGGAPGLAGGSTTGAAGGAAGNYIVGNANVTWQGLGDRRGGVA